MALNKGEWSEIYTFLKLLVDGKLYAADADLNRIEDIYYPIIKILRNEPIGSLEFCVDTSIKVCDSSGNELISLPIDDFRNKSLYLLSEIQNTTGRTFEIPDIVAFLESINVTELKAPSSQTKDITIMVHDFNTGMNPILGFSIKSYLGGDPTIVNASGSTNFVYSIQGNTLTQDNIDEINNIDTRSKIQDRIRRIEALGCSLEYSNMQSDIFKSNLTMIDSLFPKIISEMLKLYYLGQANRITDLVDILEEINPCNYHLEVNSSLYKYKVKNYLTDSALGMKAARMWDGFYNATGGYIVVKEDGDIVCYHIYNRNEFQNYLLNNTRLETPSSSRHNFGKVYEENGSLYFKLNLQVRFV